MGVHNPQKSNNVRKFLSPEDMNENSNMICPEAEENNLTKKRFETDISYKGA